jgi:hypothetical protein
MPGEFGRDAETDDDNESVSLHGLRQANYQGTTTGEQTRTVGLDGGSATYEHGVACISGSRSDHHD